MAAPQPNAIRVVDLHTAGEPVRIVEHGYPELDGANIIEKRRNALERFDHLRRMLMLEPRGHAGMYGVIPVAPCHPDADLAVLFTHQEGYSTMCGHATIALGRWAVDSGRVATVDGAAAFILEVPCGLVRVAVDGGVTTFESVDSFAGPLDSAVGVEGFGSVMVDIAYGGAFYAILPASRIGLSLMTTPLDRLVQAGAAITAAARKQLAVRHPTEPDLGFLYGTILTDDVPLGASAGEPSYNLCVFAEGQVDRSPTGSGVTARFALAAARNKLVVGQSCEVRGVSGEGFIGTLISRADTGGGIISRISVAGRAYYAGRAEFVAESEDPFAHGFAMPQRLSDLIPASDRGTDR